MAVRVGGGTPGGLGGSGGMTNPRKEEIKDRGMMGRGRRLNHLSKEEYREKRLKGLYFFCEKRFTPEHVCKNKNFRFMTIEEEPEGLGD